jgi:hypothetical protein
MVWLHRSGPHCAIDENTLTLSFRRDGKTKSVEVTWQSVRVGFCIFDDCQGEERHFFLADLLKWSRTEWLWSCAICRSRAFGKSVTWNI